MNSKLDIFITCDKTKVLWQSGPALLVMWYWACGIYSLCTFYVTDSPSNVMLSLWNLQSLHLLMGLIVLVMWCWACGTCSPCTFQSICAPSNVHPLKHHDNLQSVSPHYFTLDNIHLNQRGVGRLVLDYKLTVSADNYTPCSTAPTSTTSADENSNSISTARPQMDNKPVTDVTQNATRTSLLPPAPSAWSHPTRENQSTEINNLSELVQDLKKQMYHFNELMNNF